MRRRIFDRFVVRLILLAGSTFVLLIGLQVAAHALTAAAPSSLKTLVFVGSTLFACALMIVAYRGEVTFLERRTANEISVRQISLFVPGALLGLAIFVVTYAILWGIGAVTYEGFGQFDGVVRGCAAALAAAIGEEIVFRGAVFRLIDERFGTTAALVFSAALFALLHLLNAGATLQSTVAIALESGVLLAVAFVSARTLWLPIGIHFGWNFTEGSVFGAAVSGGKSVGIFKFSPNGGDLLTGGTFGPEASIVAVAVCLAVSSFFIWIAVHRRRWHPFQLRSVELG
jgi:CAAX protease family protein